MVARSKICGHPFDEAAVLLQAGERAHRAVKVVPAEVDEREGEVRGLAGAQQLELHAAAAQAERAVREHVPLGALQVVAEDGLLVGVVRNMSVVAFSATSRLGLTADGSTRRR